MVNRIKNKIVKVISIILAIGILIGGYFLFSYKLNPIEVIEISILQEEFEIESNTVMVVLSQEDNIESDVTVNNGNVDDSKEKNNSSSKKPSEKNQGSAVSVSKPTYTPKIQIPRTRVNLTIYSEMSVRNMERGVAILSTDNGLNQPGNTVISGHNYVNGRLFSNNHKIQVGDLIHITDSSGQKITYSVYNKYLTNPNDANYMVRDTGGLREISLTTCTNDSSQRIIILAKEI
ncbi:MAG: sortase [Clostridia bacterium]|nr:sortase [Clostridia bacterium]